MNPFFAHISTRAKQASLPATGMIVLVLCACSTTPEPAMVVEPRPAIPITITMERGPAAFAVREIAPFTGRGLVLMNGLEISRVGPYTFEAEDPKFVIEQIATDLGCVVETTPAYYFIYLKEYGEELRKTSFGGAFGQAVAEQGLGLSFGPDTPLHNALALLSHTVGYTIVADNAVAAAVTGEMHLWNVSVEDALEAILKSAVVRPSLYTVNVQADYTELISAGNRPRDELVVNRRSLNRTQRDLLSKRVSLTLPRAQDNPAHMEGQIGASTLGEVLDSMSRQLGVEVTADPIMHKLPVNPAVMTYVELETALKLVIHQWLAAEFGYEVTDGGVRLRHLPPR